MKAVRWIIVCLVLCFGSIWGCKSHAVALQAPTARPPSPSSSPPPATATAADCSLFSRQEESAEAVATVGLAERVDPAHAPHPSNDSERLLFRQLYETLIRVDCEGHAVPGLAESWRFDANENTWVVTLRQNARFSDNTPVTATVVASSWMSGSEMRSEVRRLVRSIVAVNDRTLEIALQSRRPDAVLALAHTDLAIAATVPGTLWPLGTRAVRIENSSSSVIALTGFPRSSSIRFLVAPGQDSRDLLDRGVDLLLTRDPRTLDYAATLQQYVTAPLPWQHTYVLLTPQGGRTAPSFSADARKALAMDAVRGEARGAEGPFWWESLPDCDVAVSQSPSSAPARIGRIVYDTNDTAARELAERFVGIGTYPSASGLIGDALSQALRRGNESGYILSLDRRSLDPCREMHFLIDNMGWIDPQTIVPLVDTRLRAIVRRGRSDWITEWDGGLLLGK